MYISMTMYKYIYAAEVGIVESALSTCCKPLMADRRC